MYVNSSRVTRPKITLIPSQRVRAWRCVDASPMHAKRSVAPSIRINFAVLGKFSFWSESRRLTIVFAETASRYSCAANVATIRIATTIQTTRTMRAIGTGTEIGAPTPSGPVGSGGEPVSVGIMKGYERIRADRTRVVRGRVARRWIGPDPGDP